MIRQELNPENANQSRTLDTKESYEVTDCSSRTVSFHCSSDLLKASEGSDATTMKK